MKQTVTCIVLLLLSVSCMNHAKDPDPLNNLEQSAEDQEERNFIEIDSATAARLKWVDKAVKKYVNTSDKKNIRRFRKETCWTWDRLEKRDGSTYVMVQLGHRKQGETHTVTAGWLAVDTLSQELYEYDLPNDNLVSWKH